MEGRVWKKSSEVYLVRKMRWLLCDFIAYYGPHPLRTSEVWWATSFNTFWEERRNGQEMMQQKTLKQHPKRNQAPR